MKTIELKEKDRKEVRSINEKNQWGVTCEELIQLANEHRESKEKGDFYNCALIEYRLTDINFHREVKMLENGEYDILIRENEEELIEDINEERVYKITFGKGNDSIIIDNKASNLAECLQSLKNVGFIIEDITKIEEVSE